MKAVSGVYQISNKLTGEKYIGSSVNIRKRANRHKSDLTRGAHSNILLQRAWDFYGANHFEVRKFFRAYIVQKALCHIVGHGKAL